MAVRATVNTVRASQRFPDRFALSALLGIRAASPSRAVANRQQARTLAMVSADGSSTLSGGMSGSYVAAGKAAVYFQLGPT
jgi:hypothetical protein